MSLDALLNQTVTLRRLTGETRNAIGASIATYESIETTMYLEPKTGRDVQEDRNTPVGTWLGVGRREVDFDAWSQVAVGSLVLDIIGPIRPFHNPRLGADAQVEMDLREVG